MKLKFLAGAALAATFAASGAYAQDAGWYGAVDAGWHQPEHFSVSTAASPPQTIKLHMDGGWAGFARVGYRFDPHWRLELEGGYRDGKVGTTLGFPFSGHLDDGAVMMNLVYDVAPAWSIHPFVGLGAGVDHEFVKETGGGVQFTTTGQNAFAWQGLAGLTWQASRQFNVDLTYRYFDGGHFDYNCNIPAACPVHTSEYKDDSLTIGLRYSFASPPPTPPPPPPAAASPAASAASATPAAASAASGVRGQGLRGLLPVRSVRADAGSPERGPASGSVL